MTEVKKKKGEAFVEFVISRIHADNAFRAALTRADNPATEYQSWEYLAKWCDLDKDWERRPLATIAAAIATAKPARDGYLGIGQAIATCYDDGNQSDQAKAKFRRLLACDSVIEVCRILRPLLRLISSKEKSVCYGKLVNDLMYFGDGEKIKTQWASNFYGRRQDDSIDS
ncbi:MAG: type I-E CRISPR-associated protein Cse2/CasB [Candidatus Omnitrophica bacterium]|nr:type I-E CRISPR-associated protein Cse2/CasB [Candidatus Omnitrophota bacterium]